MLKNPLLQEAEQKLEAGLAPKTLENYNKILVAGLKAGLANGPQGIVAGLQKQQDPIQACALGAINLVLYLSRMSRGTMPADAAIAAATGLMLQALDFADTAGIVKVGKEELAKATSILVSNLVRAFGISDEQLNEAARQAGSVIDNPEHLAALEQRIGGSSPQAQPRGLMNQGAT